MPAFPIGHAFLRLDILPVKNWSQVLSLVQSTIVGTCVMSLPNLQEYAFNRQKDTFWNPQIVLILVIYDSRYKEMTVK